MHNMEEEKKIKLIKYTVGMNICYIGSTDKHIGYNKTTRGF